MRLTATQRRLLALLAEPGAYGSEEGAYVWAGSDLSDPQRFNYEKTFRPLLDDGLIEFAPPDYRVFRLPRSRR